MARRVEEWRVPVEAGSGLLGEGLATAIKATRPVTNGRVATTAEPVALALPAIRLETIRVQIKGTAPLIMHKWSEKALKSIRHTEEKPKGKRHEVVVPLDEAEATTYWIDQKAGTPGFPGGGFKAALVDACRFFGKDLAMTDTKVALHLHSEPPNNLVRIDGCTRKEAVLREDWVRLSGIAGTPELRYRYEFWPWSAIIEITYPVQMMHQVTVLNLVDAAGMGGIGEWRPSSKHSKSGTYGTWTLDRDVEVQVFAHGH
jgi:hypothetical protein